MEIRLLGPVSIIGAQGEVALTRSHCRCILAVLALEVDRPVAAQALIDRVWGERLPRRVDHALYSHVSTLRKALQQADAGGEAVLRRVAGSYLLRVDPDQIDLVRARRLVEEGRSAASGPPDDAPRALDLLRRACALWHGVPLGGVGGDWAARMREGLDQERLAAEIARYRLELRLGGHARAVGTLSALIADYPMVEPLAELQMLALYRCGRQAEALALYARTRQRTVEELGDEPGEDLQRLHERILRRDPELSSPAGWEAGPVVAAAVDAPGEVTPAQLPADVAGFTGRESELAWLDSLLPADKEVPAATATIAVLDGVAGVGKTALALHWAHQVRHRFPGGQLYADLRGYSHEPPLPPLEAVTRFLHALGLRGERVPGELDEATAAYHTLVADRRILVILDNAADAEQVRPLLPAGVGSVTLVTSRHHLGGLVARDGAYRTGMEVLAPSEAHALLAEVVGGDRVQAEPAQVAKLAALCGYLPLALRVAAANLIFGRWRSVQDYVVKLEERGRLAELRAPGESHSAVAAALDLSYARRSPPERRMFRLTALIPGSEITIEAAAAVAGTGMDEAGQLLRMLAAAHLLIEPSGDRYALHDLLRYYALDLARRDETESELRAARSRLYDYYLDRADAAALWLYPERARLPLADRPSHCGASVVFRDRSRALAWMDDNLSLLAAAACCPGSRDIPRAWQIADALRGYFVLRRPMATWQAVGEAALSGAEAGGDVGGQAAAHLSLGDASLVRSRHGEAIAHYQRVLELLRQAEVDDPASAAWASGLQTAALNNLGNAHGLSGRLREAAEYHSRALALGQASGQNAAPPLSNLGVFHRSAGNLELALDLQTQALEAARAAGLRGPEASGLRQLGICYRLLGDTELAIDYLTRALSLHEREGDRSNCAYDKCLLAAAYSDAGRPATAQATEVVAFARETGDPILLVSALTTLGAIRAKRGRHLRAVDSYQDALKVVRETGDVEGGARALIGLAAAQLRLGQRKPARDDIDRALTIVREAGFRLLEAEALRVLAEIHLAEGGNSQALDLAGESLRIFEAAGALPGQVTAHVVLSRACEGDGDLDRARHHQRQARLLRGPGRVPASSC